MEVACVVIKLLLWCCCLVCLPPSLQDDNANGEISQEEWMAYITKNYMEKAHGETWLRSVLEAFRVRAPIELEISSQKQANSPQKDKEGLEDAFPLAPEVGAIATAVSAREVIACAATSLVLLPPCLPLSTIPHRYLRFPRAVSMLLSA